MERAVIYSFAHSILLRFAAQFFNTGLGLFIILFTILLALYPFYFSFGHPSDINIATNKGIKVHFFSHESFKCNRNILRFTKSTSPDFFSNKSGMSRHNILRVARTLNCLINFEFKSNSLERIILWGIFGKKQIISTIHIYIL